MKIKACQIRPGMVVCFKRNGKFNDFALIIAVKGKIKVEYRHLDFQDSYGGSLIGTINGSENVQVILGEERKRIISKIKDDVFQYLSDVENLIDIIRLIEEIGEKNET